jgi:hypothetical protein
MIDFEVEQKILKKRPEVDGLFAPNTMGWSNHTSSSD